MISRTLIAAALLGLSAATPAQLASHEPTSETPQYLSALCTLEGEWSGQFEQYDETGLIRTAPFQAGFECHSGSTLLSESNTFYQADGAAFTTLKVIFPSGDPSTLHMSYFYSQIEKVYFFSAEVLGYKDEEHWSIARESAAPKDDAAKDAPKSRYTHNREGNAFEMIREVGAGEGQSGWVLSSKLVMLKQP